MHARTATVVDPVDRRLVEMARDPPVEGARGGKVVAERFLEAQPAPSRSAEQPTLQEQRRRGLEGIGRQREIDHAGSARTSAAGCRRMSAPVAAAPALNADSASRFASPMNGSAAARDRSSSARDALTRAAGGFGESSKRKKPSASTPPTLRPRQAANTSDRPAACNRRASHRAQAWSSAARSGRRTSLDISPRPQA